MGGCSSSKLHPLASEACELLDKNVEKRKEWQSSFHEDFAKGLSQTSGPIVTLVESVSLYSRSTSSDSDETISEPDPIIERSSPSQTSVKQQDDFELSESVADAPVDDSSDLKEWLREIEETICNNPNQDTQLRHISQGERDLMRIARTTNEFNSFYKETSTGDETGSTESDHRNNLSSPCQHNELTCYDRPDITTTQYQEHKTMTAEIGKADSRSVASCPT